MVLECGLFWSAPCYDQDNDTIDINDDDHNNDSNNDLFINNLLSKWLIHTSMPKWGPTNF